MKFYREAVFGILCLISLRLYSRITDIAVQSKQAVNGQYTPTNTIVAFDIHEVITKKYIWPMLKTAYRYPHKWRMLRSSSWSLLRKTFSCVWNREWNRMRKLFQKENPYLFEFMHQIADTQTPIEGTIEIIKQLKEMGYELHILSNISESAYASFKEKFPEIFNLFDVEQILVWDGDTVIEKPNSEYFKQYLTKHNPGGKQVIFIDDQQTNINAAEKLGIIGIRFKKAQQLRNELITLGIISTEIQPVVS